MSDAHQVLRPVDHDPFALEATETCLPLTEPQAEMWAAAAMGPEANCAYNQCFVLTLHGPLRVESLQAALDGVIARHEALRAVIAPDGESQTLRPFMIVEMRILDLSALDPDSQRHEIEDLLQSEAKTPFDLAEGPLIRAFVVREFAEIHRFVLTVHHIVCDGWSSAVLFSDLGLLYAADRIGVPAHLPPAASYREYVAQQVDPDELRAAKIDEDYWAGLYPTGAPVMELPSPGSRPANKTYGSGREHLEIDGELCTALKRTGAKAGATLFTTLLAAYEALLYRLSGQSDVVIGIPVAGQAKLDDQHLVAHCVSTVPLRARLDPAAPFNDHLRAVGRQLAQAQDHSRVTFGSLVRRLRIARDRSRTPLVATTFTLDRIAKPFDFGDVTVAFIATPKSYSNFELSVTVVDNGSGLVVECDYNTDLFDAPTLRRWLRHYKTLLRGIASRSDHPLHALPLLEVEEREALAAAGEGLPFGPSGCLHERFEAWAKRAPERVAVVCDEESLSYGTLDRRANALAFKLQALGVRGGVLVGLRTERSLSMVVGILGILKAGGAYVPLDPAYPKDRVDFMLADSEVQVVVTEAAFVDELQATHATLMVIDQDRDEAVQGPESTVQPHDLAYVIYTSGSTGKPKGVLVRHGELTNYLTWASALYQTDGQAGVPINTPLAFDATVTSLYVPLLLGWCVHLLPEDRQIEALADLLASGADLSLVKLTPAHLEMLRSLLGPKASAVRARLFVVGGEVLPSAAAAFWREQVPSLRIVNEYGPTETVVGCCVYEVGAEPLPGREVPIGRPTPNTRLYVLDGALELVPVGVTGELYIGGSQLAAGYLNRPGLTAERFVADPYAATPGARMYRTGDLARWRAEGTLEFRGRIDDQVKIRGFRIELGEIEAVLGQHPDIAHAVVVARQDANDKRLVAYIVAHNHTTNLIDDLKTQLRTHLPEYMVPAHFVSLTDLPLTPNGKVDRNALPEPSYKRPENGRPYTSPRTSTEETVAAIWAAVLGAPQVSINDNFFELGGHSLKAAQIIAALRSTFGVDAAMRHLFEQPTIAGLAAIVDVLAVSVSRQGSAAGSQREEVEI